MAYVSLVRERKRKGKPWRIRMFACQKCRRQYEFAKPRSIRSLLLDGHVVVTHDGTQPRDDEHVSHIVCSACIAHEESMFQGAH